MRKSILILFFLWSFLGYSQNDLYCLKDSAGWYWLSNINTSTGLITDIGNIPVVIQFYVLGNKQCINTHDSTYTFAGHDGNDVRLYSVDLATGNIISNPVFNKNVVGLQYSCEDSTIYAIEEVTTNNYYLVTVDKATGATTQKGIVGGVTAYVGDAFVLDVKRGLYHLFGLWNSNIHMYSVDIKTGLVTASPAFPDNVTGLVYNCDDSTAYGVWEDGPDYKLERLDPTTGTHSTVGKLTNITPGFVAESASISRNGAYTYRGFSGSNDPFLITVDVQTAGIIDSVSFTSNVSGIDHYVCCADPPSTVGINELTKKELSVYPNPFNEQVKLEWGVDVQNASIKIYDVYGKEVYSENKITGSSYSFKRNNLSSGVYFVELVNNEGLNWVGKIIAE